MEMQRGPLPRTCDIRFFRKVQISLIVACFVCYALSTIYLVWFHRLETHKPLLEKCREDYPAFVEEFYGAPFEGVSKRKGFHTSCPCVNTTCLPKCCPLDLTFDKFVLDAPGYKMPCVSPIEAFMDAEEREYNAHPWHSPRGHRTNRRETQMRYMRLVNLRLQVLGNINTMLVGKPLCKSMKYKYVNRYFYERSIHGSRALIIPEHWKLLDLNDYCVEYVGNDLLLQVWTVFDCADQEMEAPNLIADITKTYHLIDVESHVSLLFISVTVSVYLFFQQLRNAYGKTLVCYLTTLWATMLVHVITESYKYKNPVLEEIGSILVTSDYYWSTAICFDLWSTFSRPLKSVSQRSTKHWKLVASCLYSLAFPSVWHVLFKLKFSEIADSEVCKQLQYENDICTSAKRRSLRVWGSLPIYLQVSLNLVMYAATVFNLRHHFRRTSSRLSGAESRRHAGARETLWMYLKLSLVVGLPYKALSRAFDVVFDPQDVDLLVTVVQGHLLRISPIVLSLVLLLNERVLELLGLTGRSARAAEQEADWLARMLNRVGLVPLRFVVEPIIRGTPAAESVELSQFDGRRS